MNENANTLRTVEINGVKLDVDLRTAVRVDTLRVGDRVRCLVKNYSGYAVHPGVVVGFEPFKNLPTITVCYVTPAGDLQFVALNDETKDFELVPALDEVLMLERETVVQMMNREINRRRTELEQAQEKLAYFERMFGRWFEAEKTPGGIPA